MRELNLIPDQIKQQKERQQLLIKSIAAGLLLVSVLAAAASMPYLKLKKLSEKERELKVSMEKAKPVLELNMKLKKETELYKGYIALIDKVQKSSPSQFIVLKNLEKYVPSDIIFTNLSLNKDSLNVTAAASKYNSINEFLANLQESKEFSSSMITNVTVDEKTGQNTFNLIVKNIKGEVK
jgi:type IV pilus assembly protein PilN